MKRIIALTIFLVGSTAGSAPAQAKLETVLKKFDAVIEPAEARPGQTVTLKIRVELEKGWYTYPTIQTDPGARAQVNSLTLPVEQGNLIYVGKLIQPPNPDSRPEPIIGVEKLLFYPDGAIYEYKLVVSPYARPGDLTTAVKFKIVVCKNDTCIPKTSELKAAVKVAGDPVPVEAKFKEEVEKALKK